MRDLKLVLKDNNWHIAFKTAGRLGDRRIMAWLRAVDEKFICEEDKADQVEDLPRRDVTNFYGDHFTFAIDETDGNGKTIEKLAGLNNITAARAAYFAYLKAYTANRSLILRQRGPIIEVIP